MARVNCEASIIPMARQLVLGYNLQTSAGSADLRFSSWLRLVDDRLLCSSCALIFMYVIDRVLKHLSVYLYVKCNEAYMSWVGRDLHFCWTGVHYHRFHTWGETQDACPLQDLMWAILVEGCFIRQLSYSIQSPVHLWLLETNEKYRYDSLTHQIFNRTKHSW